MIDYSYKTNKPEAVKPQTAKQAQTGMSMQSVVSGALNIPQGNAAPMGVTTKTDGFGRTS